MTDYFNWKCPYCNTQTTIIPRTNASEQVHYQSLSKGEDIGLCIRTIDCPNPDCKEYTIEATLYEAQKTYHQRRNQYGDVENVLQSVGEPLYR